MELELTTLGLLDPSPNQLSYGSLILIPDAIVVIWLHNKPFFLLSFITYNML